MRAVIGQQVSVKAACTVSSRLASRCGTPVPEALAAHGFTHLFPAPGVLAEADLVGIGRTRGRAHTIRSMARAVAEGRVDFARERTLDDFVARWVALHGVGPWTAQYIAMRALSHPDAIPAEDLVLRQALTNDGTRCTAGALRARAESWRPWRAYGVMHLWHDMAGAALAGGRSTTR